MYNPYSLDGKTILVTGASSGIGQATAIECSKMGAQLILTGRNKKRLNETLSSLLGEGHTIVDGDLTSSEDIQTIVNQLPILQGAVLCAGKGMTLPFPFCVRDKYDEIFEINFFAPMELLRLLVKKKKLDKESSVVMVSSIGGVTKFSMGNGIYGASKAALSSAMKTCARELAQKKIRVNCVNPGMVETKLIHSGTLTEEQHEQDMQKYPLKRYGQPSDIAFGIIYLLSDASSWVTGTNLFIDGGASI